MKKILGLAILLMLAVLPALKAQDVAKAKEILAKVSKKYKGYSAIKADFKQTVEIPSEKYKEEQKGSLYLKKSKFKLVMNEQTVICDGKTMWTIANDEVTVTNYNPKSMGINPSEMFTMYENGYNYAYMGEEKVNGKAAYLIELTPNDKKKAIFKVKLYVDKATNAVIKSKIFEKNGNIYTYEVTNLEGNAKLDDKLFAFDKAKYPKYEIVDLRN